MPPAGIAAAYAAFADEDALIQQHKRSIAAREAELLAKKAALEQRKRELLLLSASSAANRADDDDKLLRAHLDKLNGMLVERYGAAHAPRFSFNGSLPCGPHLGGELGRTRLPASVATPLLDQIAEGLTPLSGLELHRAMPLAATNAAVSLLTATGHDDAMHGLGRAMLDKAGRGQVQYLIDLSDPIVNARFEALRPQPALCALRAIMDAVVESGGVGSIPGMADATPATGIADWRHFWLRISSGGPPPGEQQAQQAEQQQQQQHFNTNGNADAEDSEACWHADNPRSPTEHATARMLLKLYGGGGGGGGGDVHVLELRGAPLAFQAEVAVPAGDGVIMGDIARGSSRAAVSSPRPCVEHRGRCPVGEWQLELVLNCVVCDRERLVRSLRDVAKELRERHSAQGLGPSLAEDGCSLAVDASSFVNHPLLATKEGAKQRFLSNAVAASAAAVMPIAVAVAVADDSRVADEVEGTAKENLPVAVPVPLL